MSQIFHMPLLLSYFQAALPAAVNCVVANNVQRSTFSFLFFLYYWAAAACPGQQHTRPSHRPQHNLNFICMCVWQKLKSKQLVDIFTVQWIFHVSWTATTTTTTALSTCRTWRTMTMRSRTSANVSAYNLVAVACFIYLCRRLWLHPPHTFSPAYTYVMPCTISRQRTTRRCRAGNYYSLAVLFLLFWWQNTFSQGLSSW